MHLLEDHERQKIVDLDALSEGALSARVGYYDSIRIRALQEWDMATELRDKAFETYKRNFIKE